MRAAVALALLLVLPLAAAALPTLPGPGQDVISSHAIIQISNNVWTPICSSTDPVLWMFSTSLTSRLDYAANGDGTTSFDLRLDAAPGDPACPAFEFEFRGAVEWPPAEGSSTDSSGLFDSACGASGRLHTVHYPESRVMSLIIHEMPEACGVPAAPGQAIQFYVNHAHVDTAFACTPLVTHACVGVDEGSFPLRCGDRDETNVHVLWFGVAGGSRGQSFDCSGGYTGAYVLTAHVEATDEGCVIHHRAPRDLALSVPEASLACPEPIGKPLSDAIRGVAWGDLLP